MFVDMLVYMYDDMLALVNVFLIEFEYVNELVYVDFLVFIFFTFVMIPKQARHCRAII